MDFFSFVIASIWGGRRYASKVSAESLSTRHGLADRALGFARRGGGGSCERGGIFRRHVIA
jgi:hypothetical protein